jgi:hypothetical protein
MTAKDILKSGRDRGVQARQPEADQMTVLVANSTPYVIWRLGGGLVGACRTQEQAIAIMKDLKFSFPGQEYICRDVDGDLCGDTRLIWHHDGQIANDTPATAPREA